MSWLEVDLLVRPLEPWRDLLMVELLDLGYEGFEETAHGLRAYGRKDLVDPMALRHLRTARDPHCSVSHVLRELPDENWNARWENSFQPIEVDGRVHIRAEFHPEAPGFEHQLIVTPKMAFGTGHHATTRMMVRAMLPLPLKGQRVLDLGCGTGVLAILAERLGAQEVLAVDNDPTAVANARETVALNRCERVLVEEGGTDLRGKGTFNAILANIERNVLIQAMPGLQAALAPGGTLLLSGFIRPDLTRMADAATASGLRPGETRNEGEWCLLGCTKPEAQP
jgi:ribosomal protein L11 methyltransferase